MERPATLHTSFTVLATVRCTSVLQCLLLIGCNIKRRCHSPSLSVCRQRHNLTCTGIDPRTTPSCHLHVSSRSCVHDASLTNHKDCACLRYIHARSSHTPLDRVLHPAASAEAPPIKFNAKLAREDDSNKSIPPRSK